MAIPEISTESTSGLELLANPYWHALATEQASIAEGGPLARRFPADVIPFAGIPEVSDATLTALRALLRPGERVLLTSDAPLAHAGLRETRTLHGLQMLCTPEAQAQAMPQAGVLLLEPVDVPAMMELNRIAFPGYFGPRAATLGSFYGIRVQGEMVAMAGERLALPGWREVSAVSTHPAHAGRGYAATLIRHLLHSHAQAGLRSFLGVSAENRRAISLYQRLGFEQSRTLLWRTLERVA